MAVQFVIAVLIALATPPIAEASTALPPLDRYHAASTYPAAGAHLNGCGDIAPAGGDTYWVADTLRNRILKIDVNGVVLKAVGSRGSASGQFMDPQGICVGADGRVYVADAGNARIQVFSSTGAFLSKFGSNGTGDGQFRYPTAVAVDTGGTVWVSDTTNNRIQKLTNTGVFLTKIGGTAAGSGALQLSYPRGITLDAAGHVFVADGDNNRVQAFNADGSFYRSFGALGQGDLQFQSPRDVAFDAQGRLHVADYSNRVRVYAYAGSTYALLLTYGSAPTTDEYWTAGKLWTPQGLTVDGSGRSLVVDAFGLRVWDSPSAFRSQCVSGNPTAGTPYRPQGMVYSNGYVWVVDWTNGVAKYSVANGQLAFVSRIRQYNSGGLRTIYANDVDVDDQGNLYLLASQKVIKLSPAGDFLAEWGAYGSGDGQFQWASGICVNGTNVFVCDSNLQRVQVFTTSGAFLAKFGSFGAGVGQFYSPRDVRVRGGVLYVVDSGRNSIVTFSASSPYAQLDVIGGTGSGLGYLTLPAAIAFDFGGNMFVAEDGGTAVTKYSSGGVPLARFGSSGTDADQFAGPVGIAVGDDGTVFVSDADNDRLAVWRADNATSVSLSAGLVNGFLGVVPQLTYQLRNVDGQPLIDEDVRVESAPSAEGPWSIVRLSSTGAVPLVTTLAPIPSPTWYRVRFNGDHFFAASASAPIKVDNSTMISLSALTPKLAYGATPRFAATLTDAAGTPLPGATLMVERAVSASGPFVPAGTIGSVSPGASIGGAVTGATYFRVRFDGAGGRTGSTSPAVRVEVPLMKVGTPSAPKTAKRTKAFAVTGYLWPAHPTGSSVRVLLYKKSGKSWKYQGYVKAKKSAAAGKTKYRASVKLRAGTWRLKARCPKDGTYLETTSSGHDTVTVR